MAVPTPSSNSHDSTARSTPLAVLPSADDNGDAMSTARLHPLKPFHSTTSIHRLRLVTFNALHSAAPFSHSLFPHLTMSFSMPSTVWDAVAYKYAEMAAELTTSHVRHAVGLLIPYLPPPTSTRLRALDVACGTGAATFVLASQGLSVLATDYSQVMVDIVGDRARRLGLTEQVQTQVMDATKLDGLEEGVYDVVYIAFALFALPEPLKAVQGLMRGLKKGGLLVCTHWLSCDESQFHYILMEVMRELTPQRVDGFRQSMAKLHSKEAMTALFTQAGLQMVDCHRHFETSRQIINSTDYAQLMYAMPGPPMSPEQMAAQDVKVKQVIGKMMGPEAPFSFTAGSITTVGRKQ